MLTGLRRRGSIGDGESARARPTPPLARRYAGRAMPGCQSSWLWVAPRLGRGEQGQGRLANPQPPASLHQVQHRLRGAPRPAGAISVLGAPALAGGAVSPTAGARCGRRFRGWPSWWWRESDPTGAPSKANRPSGSPRLGERWRCGGGPYGVTQLVTAAPDGLDVILAAGRLDELLA